MTESQIDFSIPKELCEMWAQELIKNMKHAIAINNFMDYHTGKLYDILPLTRQFSFGYPTESFFKLTPFKYDHLQQANNSTCL